MILLVMGELVDGPVAVDWKGYACYKRGRVGEQPGYGRADVGWLGDASKNRKVGCTG
jgi:hypothetical protein